MPFTIDPNTGEILVDGNLDRETTDSYDLTIQARDGMACSVFCNKSRVMHFSFITRPIQILDQTDSVHDTNYSPLTSASLRRGFPNIFVPGVITMS